MLVVCGLGSVTPMDAEELIPSFRLTSSAPNKGVVAELRWLCGEVIGASQRVFPKLVDALGVRACSAIVIQTHGGEGSRGRAESRRYLKSIHRTNVLLLEN